MLNLMLKSRINRRAFLQSSTAAMSSALLSRQTMAAEDSPLDREKVYFTFIRSEGRGAVYDQGNHHLDAAPPFFMCSSRTG